MNKDKLKRQYFKKGARALKKLISIDQDCYCCPLCKKMFLPKALEVGILTLEHAPPKEVGGRPLALTCKECNSIAGYSIDAAVVNREKFKITPLARYHQKYSKVGDLKTAFIICFAFFGYTFVLNKRLSPIREQIIGYKDEIIDRYWIVSDPKIN